MQGARVSSPAYIKKDAQKERLYGCRCAVGGVLLDGAVLLYNNAQAACMNTKCVFFV